MRYRPELRGIDRVGKVDRDSAVLASSIALLVYSQAPLDVWKQALRENAYLIVMFIMVPLLGIPVQHGGYSESLRGMFARYASTDSRYYALVSSMSAFVGVLISIAAVPLTYEVSRASRCTLRQKASQLGAQPRVRHLHDMGADVGDDRPGRPADGHRLGGVLSFCYRVRARRGRRWFSDDVRKG
ncbi:MAG: hypothetical protein V8R48_06545 [Eggerthella lenta]